MSLAIADNWYDVEVLSKGVTWIDELHIQPWAVGNIWLIEGTERSLVFDTGTGIGDLANTVATLTDKPVIAIASTGYYDHAGGLSQFEQRGVHPLEAARVSKPTARSTVSDKYLKQSALKAIPYDGFSAEDYIMHSSEPTQLLDEGDRIDIGGRYLDVMHIPGVTEGSIALYEEKTGLLFSGESLSDGDPFYYGEPDDESNDANNQAHRASMRRLLELDISTVYPGHYAPFEALRLRKILNQYLNS